MRKRCMELKEINHIRIDETLGSPADNRIVDSESANSSEDDSSSQISLSEINDDLVSHQSKRSAKKDTRQPQMRVETAFSPKSDASGNADSVQF